MKNFELPVIDVLEFRVEDVITASGNDTPGGNYTPGEGGVGGGMGM